MSVCITMTYASGTFIYFSRTSFSASSPRPPSSKPSSSSNVPFLFFPTTPTSRQLLLNQSHLPPSPTSTTLAPFTHAHTFLFAAPATVVARPSPSWPPGPAAAARGEGGGGEGGGGGGRTVLTMSSSTSSQHGGTRTLRLLWVRVCGLGGETCGLDAIKCNERTSMSAVCGRRMSHADISCGQARWCVRQAHKEHESKQAEHVLMVDKGVR